MGRCDVANLPKCGPILILFPVLKQWGPPIAHVWATCDLVPSSQVLQIRDDGKRGVTNLPTCGSLLILSPALKRWGPPKMAWVM